MVPHLRRGHEPKMIRPKRRHPNPLRGSEVFALAMSKLYMSAAGGLSKKYTQAVDWFTIAEEQGSKSSMECRSVLSVSPLGACAMPCAENGLLLSINRNRNGSEKYTLEAATVSRKVWRMLFSGTERPLRMDLYSDNLT